MKLDTEKTTVYLPLRLKTAIADEAKVQHRSDNSQVVHALENYFFSRMTEDPMLPKASPVRTPAIPVVKKAFRKILMPHNGGGKLGSKPVSICSPKVKRRKSA